MNFKQATLPILALCSVTLTTGADSIDPISVERSIDLGETTVIEKKVTVDAGKPTAALVDVMFLFDTTGSMGAEIGAVKASASSIITDAGGFGDVAFGVSHYEDFPVNPFGSAGDVPYALLQDVTTDTMAVQDAIDALALGFGNDFPESNLFALSEAASTSAWRDGSTRIMVWFGDAPGHDGDLEAPLYPSDVGLMDAIDALTAENIIVEAINVGALDSTGQATAITDATGGDLFNSVTPATIVDAISDALDAAFATYNTVSLDLSEVPAGLTATVDPVEIVGDFDRSIARMFEFDLSITGDAVGVYEFDIHALVDGGRVAVESDRITVGTVPPKPTDPTIPEPITAGLGLIGIGALGSFATRRR